MYPHTDENLDEIPQTWEGENGLTYGQCVGCGTLCNTGNDACSPLDFCQDCGEVTCPDHRSHESHK